MTSATGLVSKMGNDEIAIEEVIKDLNSNTKNTEGISQNLQGMFMEGGKIKGDTAQSLLDGTTASADTLALAALTLVLKDAGPELATEEDVKNYLTPISESEANSEVFDQWTAISDATDKQAALPALVAAVNATSDEDLSPDLKLAIVMLAVSSVRGEEGFLSGMISSGIKGEDK
jgi:hypothetical protein